MAWRDGPVYVRRVVPGGHKVFFGALQRAAVRWGGAVGSEVVVACDPGLESVPSAVTCSDWSMMDRLLSSYWIPLLPLTQATLSSARLNLARPMCGRLYIYAAAMLTQAGLAGSKYFGMYV